MLKIAVFVSGGGTNLQAIIDNIESKKIRNSKISLVLSNKKDAYALERAKKHNILGKVLSRKDFDTNDDYCRQLLDVLESMDIDLIVLAGYLAILPKAIIDRYPNRIINVHPSLIPAFSGKGYYGLKVHEGVLERGCKVTGATVHFVDEGTDTGPIILQKAVLVKDDDTPESLQKKVMEEAEWLILPQAIDLIANDKIKVVDRKVFITK
ncbi:MAG: phosphoribosylglycinamide formyltransferase [Clostridiales bacterium]|jgi:phosphoribosylglycinamide formyltransferase-1|nr:phosphoribosylglycinamide formyltransferase [Clostridiales bacterium]